MASPLLKPAVRTKPRVPPNAWDILPTRPPPLKVVEGLRGEELCVVQPKADWTFEHLVPEVTAATGIPGEQFRLLFRGTPLEPGKFLPGALLTAGDLSFSVTLVRVDPSWLESLDEILDGLAPQAPSIEDLCAGRFGALANAQPLTSDKRDMALAAVQHEGSMLLRCAEDLLRDKELVMAAVRECGIALRYVPEPLLSDREVVLTAVNADGEALRLAPKELLEDREIVSTALASTGEAIQYASNLLKQDRSLLLEAVKRTAKAFLHVPPLLQRDKAFVIAAVRVNGDVLTFAPPEIRVDKEVMLAAKAYWAGEGDAPPNGEGWIRMAHLWQPKAQKKAPPKRLP